MLSRALILITLLTAPLRAEVITVDPRVIIDEMKSYYRAVPAPEHVEVRVTSEGQTRAETLMLIIRENGAFQVGFSDYRLWREGEFLRAVHRADGRTYLEVPVTGNDPLATLAANFPPFPLPQLAAAVARDPAAALTPYTSGARWTEGTVHPDEKPPFAVARAKGSRVAATLTIDASCGKLISMVTELDDGRTRIEVTASPLPAAQTPPFGAELSRRRQVSDLAEMKIRPGDIRVGDTLPELGLLSFIEGNEIPGEPTGPAALLLFRRWNTGLTPLTAAAAIKRVADERPGFSAWPVIVLSVLDTEQQSRIRLVKEILRPLTVHQTYSPETSIERFSEEAPVVLVVIDAKNTVRAIIELPAPKPDEPIDNAEATRLADQIRAALK